MKVGFVLDDGLDKPDGVQQYVLTLGAWLTANGHEVRYLVGETWRKDIDNIYSLAKNIKVRFNGNILTIPLPASSKKIKKVLEDEQFDVLHVQVPYSPFFGEKVIKMASPSTAVVGTFHILPYGFLSKIGSRLLGLYLQKSLRRFDKMLSVSKPAAEFAQKSFRVNSSLSSNSINISRFRGDKNPAVSDAIKILFLGRLVPRKGVAQLLIALKILNEQNRLPADLSVDICGDGQMRNSLEKYVSNNGLGETVKFHGFIAESDKPAYVQSADIAIFPSLSGESFGIVLLEAMAAGNAVVLAGNNPGYMSVMHDVPDSIIDAHNPEVLAEQLNEILTNKSKRVELHKSQQKHIKKFDTSVVAAELIQIYEACKSKRSS